MGAVDELLDVLQTTESRDGDGDENDMVRAALSLLDDCEYRLAAFQALPGLGGLARDTAVADAEALLEQVKEIKITLMRWASTQNHARALMGQAGAVAPELASAMAEARATAPSPRHESAVAARIAAIDVHAQTILNLMNTDLIKLTRQTDSPPGASVDRVTELGRTVESLDVVRAIGASGGWGGLGVPAALGLTSQPGGLESGVPDSVDNPASHGLDSSGGVAGASGRVVPEPVKGDR